MDRQEIKQTPIWELFERGRNYHRTTGIYVDTDRNYRMYNGDQWAGAKLDGLEPVQQNFIKPIVKYKIAVVHDNLYAIVYSSQNYKNTEFRENAERYITLLNRYAAKIWERDKMDFKGRRVTKDAAVNDEGIVYVDYDTERNLPVNEVLKKNDVYYGNENDDDIQNQPYILIRKRMPVANAVDFAEKNGVSKDKMDYIRGDNDTFEESGDASENEVDSMVTIVYKFFKLNGTVHYSVATRWVEIIPDQDMGIKLYPLAHMVWEEKEGSARGEGEVRYLIPNQIEVNKTLMRRALAVKTQAFPQKVIDTEKITNPDAIGNVGGIIRTQGMTVDDVRKVVGVITPAQMSPDVAQLQQELIQTTRELAGAGDVASGTVNPESASGRAILAVQQASQAPMNEQKEAYKNLCEDLARIWLEFLTVYSADGVDMEDEQMDPMTGDTTVTVEKVPQSALKELQASVKIDVTPKGVYDRFAQEQTIENLLLQGFLSPQRISELEIYYKLLDDDSVAPKQKIKEAIKYVKGEQMRIAQMEAQAQSMIQRTQQYLMEEPEAQASQILTAQQMNNQAPI